MMSLSWVDLFRQPQWTTWLVTKGKCTWLSPHRDFSFLKLSLDSFDPRTVYLLPRSVALVLLNIEELCP